MVVITAIYVFATILICYFNGKSASAAQKQIIEANRQQQQNANIQLYTLRRRVLNIFNSLKKKEILLDFNFLFSDVNVLFNEEIFERFKYLCDIQRKRKNNCEKMNLYSTMLANKSNSAYTEFANLISNAQKPYAMESDWEEVYKFCDKYTFEQKVGNEIEMYNYKNLDIERRELLKEERKLYNDLASEMQDFIKKSIEMP